MKRLLILLLLLCAGQAWGADHYIRDGASGDGSDWTNAWDDLPATLTRGDTYWIADGSYAAYTFDDAESDTTRIALRKATEASHGTATGWDNAYDDSTACFTGRLRFTTGYFIVDGVSGTLDGTFGIKAHQQAEGGKCVQIDTGASNIAMSYVEMRNWGYTSDESGSDCLYMYQNITDCTFYKCWLRNASRTHVLIYGSSGNTWDNCWFTECYGDDSVGIHGESFSINSTPTNAATNTIKNSVFRNVEGSGWICLMNNGTRYNRNWEIYNNLFYCDAAHILDGYVAEGEPAITDFTGSNGVIVALSSSTVALVKVYGNTFANMQQTALVGLSGSTFTEDSTFVYNNLAITDDGYTHTFTGTNTGDNVSTSDTTYVTSYGVFDLTLAKATDLGTVLAAPFDTDITGATRADNDGAWDIGAYEFDATGGDGADASETITYYVHPDSSGTGGPNDPFGTIAAAEAVADSNDVIVLDGNLAGQGITVAADGMTYRSRSTASPAILGGPKPLTGWTAQVAGGESVSDSTTTGADSQLSVDTAGNDTFASSGTYNAVGRSSATLYFNGALQCTLSTTNFDEFTSVTLKLNCILARTGADSLRIKIKVIEAAAPSDTTSFQSLLYAATDSVYWAVWNPAVQMYETPDLSGIFNDLTINGTDIVQVILGDNGSTSNSLYLRYTTIEGVSEGNPAAELFYTYTQTGGDATLSYRLLTGTETSATRFWRNGTMGTSVDLADLDTTGEYCVSGDTLYVAIADTSGWTCDGYGANAVDLNEKRGVTLHHITVLGTGVSGHVVYADGSQNNLYNLNIVDGLKGIYALGDTITVKNTAFRIIDAGSDSVIICETGTGVVYTHLAFESGAGYQVPASPAAEWVLQDGIFTDSDYTPIEHLRDAGTDVGLDYNSTAPEIGAVELDARDPRAHYVDATSGSDSNTGLTTGAPWQTITKINGWAFIPGDSILFKRGETWTGQIVPPDVGTSALPIVYGAYGSGDKPIINAVVNKSETADWVTHSGDIYKCAAGTSDIGSVMLDSDLGHKRWSLAALNEDHDFFYDADKDSLYYRLAAGNPGTTYTLVELLATYDLFAGSDDNYITIENIHFTKTGADGYLANAVTGVTIQDCDFSYIGGGHLAGTDSTRYGNGMTWIQSASNGIVRRCKFWECYDAGMSWQNTSASAATANNLQFYNNIVWNCEYNFEVFNSHADSRIDSLLYFNNTSYNSGGQALHSQRPVTANSNHIMFSDNDASADSTTNIIIKNNIFHTNEATSNLMFVVGFNGIGNITVDYNAWEYTSFAMWDDDADGSGTYCADFDAWVTLSSQGAHGYDGDPLLTDPENEDFTLQSGSPVKDSGTSMGLTTDYLGLAYSGSPPMGAYDYQDVSGSFVRIIWPRQPIFSNGSGRRIW